MNSFSDIEDQKRKKKEATELLPNRFLIAFCVGFAMTFSKIPFNVEITPILFYQIVIDLIRTISTSLVVVTTWMSMFVFFVGDFKRELIWFGVLMTFLFATEVFIDLWVSALKFSLEV